jgi:hypothetical protein
VSFSIERVDWKDERETAGALLTRSFPSVPLERYDWLHEANPAGSPALWLARTPDGRAVGTAAVHARHVVVGGRTYRAGVAADFAVDPSVRGFGPALPLQRAVVAACDSGEFAFIYGFPNGAARGVFERIGYGPGRTRRLARPLRLRPYLERSVASLARFVAAPLDLAVRLLARDTYGPASRGSRFETVEAFDDSFDAFWTPLQRRHAVVAARDHDYLNWRYAKCPTRRYELGVLRRGAELQATIVSYRINGIVHIAEVLARDPKAFDGVVVAFLREQRRAGADAVSFTALGRVCFAGRLAKYGFAGREVERAMMVYVPPALRGALDAVERWCLFEGDIL